METNAAWKSFQAAEWRQAMQHAEECLRKSYRRADRMEAELARQPEKPPLGIVTDVQKMALVKRGVLNDMATAYCIRGRAADRLGDKALAEQELRQAMKYPSAHCWYERGLVQSPAEAADACL